MSCKNIQDATDAVQHAVTQWLSKESNLPQNQVDISLTFYQKPRKGYGQTKGRYQRMCDDVDQALSRDCQRHVITASAWRDKHRTDVIALFIGELAAFVLQSPNQPQAPQVIAWLDQ
jgi:hypothetical protein